MAVLIIIVVFVIAALIGLLGWAIARDNRKRRGRQRPKATPRPTPTVSGKPAPGQSADARHERSRQWWEQAAAAQRKRRQGREIAAETQRLRQLEAAAEAALRANIRREIADAADELLVEYEQQREADQRLAGAALLSVLDGDTISVVAKNGAETRVRLYAIDAPELEQSGGYAARDFLERLLKSGGGFTMSTHYTDRYGRVVATLYPKTGIAESYNWAMVAYGHAHWLPDFGGAELGMNDAQQFAQSKRRGIWQQPAPELPASFRRRQQDAAVSPSRRARAFVEGPAASPGISDAPLPPRTGDATEETLLALVLQNETELVLEATTMVAAEWFSRSENREVFRIITGDPAATAAPGPELAVYLEQLRSRHLRMYGTPEQALQKLCRSLQRQHQNNAIIELTTAVQESGDLYSAAAAQIAELKARRIETDRDPAGVQ